MFQFVFDKKHRLVGLKPDGVMNHDDFALAKEKIHQFIKEHGDVAALLIEPPKSYKHWDSFTGLITQLKFVDDKHKKITKVALVSDVPLMAVVNRIAYHFSGADVQEFTMLGPALRWAIKHD